MEQTKTDANEIGSIPPNSEVKALTGQVDTLKADFTSWDSSYIWLGGLTVLVAGILFIVQFIAHKKGDRLRESQDALIQAKDRELATDLRAKDLLISQARLASSEADRRAGEANQAAAIANGRAGK